MEDSKVPKNRTAFNEAAGEIAKGIHKTSGMLTKLTNIVRRQVCWGVLCALCHFEEGNVKWKRSKAVYGARRDFSVLRLPRESRMRQVFTTSKP